MNPLFTLAFLVFFDATLLIGLGHYYRRLGYPFLKYGALALAVEVIIQFLTYGGVPDGRLQMTAISLTRIVYVGFLMACASDVTGRAFPRRWYGAVAAVFVVAVVYVFARVPSATAANASLALPSTALLLSIAWLLVRYRSPGSIGSPWFAGVILMHLALKWSLLLTSNAGTVPAQVAFLDNIVLLLVGVALVMITSERAISELVRRDERLEEVTEERHRLQLQFAHAQKLESLGVLAGGIAHDFNNMLTSVLGYASLAMKKLPNDSDIRKDLYMVMSGARQAVDLTSQMLIYAGKGALEFEAADVSKVADDMSSLIHSIIPRKIRLIQKLARDLPALKGDKVQLGQVLMNLVANAVDAIEDIGTIEITTGLAEVDRDLLKMSFFGQDREPGAYLYLRVKDSGIGIAEDQVERIFDPFYSEKRTSKGLGLSSLSGIVRQHNGFIGVRSKPGEGSEFTVYFPVLSYQESDADSRYMAQPTEKIKGNVLLAEDDPRIRSLMASILEGGYFKLSSVEDGKEALRVFQEEPSAFDLLVLDCTMPKMSGPEVYRKIRAGGSTIPVVLVSGYHQEQVIANISNDANARFVKKPFNVDDFLEAVMAALGAGQPVQSH